MRTLPFGRALALVLTLTAACATAGCNRKPEGAVKVLVIDGEPKVAEPQQGPLTPSEKVMVDNVAQGLVRFDARGQVEPGLAEAWNVSDDGLSYIFRLANGEWPDGRKITAEQVARMLRRTIARSSRNPLKDAFGAVDDIVAMTDRVIEIRLNQPRPHLLQLLAQPEMGLVYSGQGTGPFSIDRAKSMPPALTLVREIPTIDEERTERELLTLAGEKAPEAVRAFASNRVDLVLGGTFADLPFAQRANLGRNALQFDPASGLFGLVPATDDGILANPDVRLLLSQAIDRDALMAAFAVPGLVPRATVLEPGLDTSADPVPPAWVATPIADRRPELVAAAAHLLPKDKKPTIRIALPEGPGAQVLFNRLAQDWGVLGITVERTDDDSAADLKLIDEVAPSSSPAWFVRRFRCDIAPICDEQVDEMLETARSTAIPAQRSALLAQAAQRIDTLELFIPIAAPIRWSLVSDRITGFAGNRFAIHTLTGLEERLDRTGD